MSTETNITDQLRAAVAARIDSLRALRGRIVDLLEPIPVGVTLSDDAGEVCRISRVHTGASQWANRTWEVTIKGWAAIAGGKLLAECIDGSYHDGSNMHYRKSEPTCLGSGSYDSEPEALRWLSGAETRALAMRLPAAIARYMEQCEVERVANNSALATTQL